VEITNACFLNILFITISALLILAMTLLPNCIYKVNVKSIRFSREKLSHNLSQSFDK